MHLNTGQNRPTFQLECAGMGKFFIWLFFHSPAGHLSSAVGTAERMEYGTHCYSVVCG